MDAAIGSGHAAGHAAGHATRRRVAAALVCLGLLLTSGCMASSLPTCPKSGTAQCTRVLFLGNSYTYVNDLPATFARLGQSGGQQLEVASVANGGETLTDHDRSADSLAKIKAERWTYVVLQEQSETPATSSGRDFMYPAARELAAKAENIGATPMFFITWAHRDGWPEAGMPNYDSMQQAIDNAYLEIAGELVVPVAPVGVVWYYVRHDHPEISLWIDDGSHPTAAGTYLAACVFYASIFRQSPVGLSYHGDVSDALARTLQDEAATHVLDSQSQWGLR